MKELLVVPIMMLALLGTLTQLEDIAQDTSNKAINFSDDMNKAMECATKGIPIRECSPKLMSGYNFSEEQKALQDTIKQLQEELNNTEI